ncbi:pilus assembly PilX family protein [Microbulbifer rhizosphaerae]|uniref:Type IV pilus assembly protein PilX n=1 Tax=Microbulbifer rhizosphaerae TaxID=1562603 RepID=A0A7W4WES9_9GAMM|nr:PilX N-terminal domain-containing pilus assembly protein [Microbulbifer rhizosphaerae]MBB3062422.1 type IV pilus assembly protein PilX [Microbulbifer rhizosphaerae]
MRGPTRYPTPIRTQRGAVLLVGLVMLLLMTIVGLAAVRSSKIQELMAGNMRDRNLAFQAAEAGLRAGEQALEGMTLPSFDGSAAGYLKADSKAMKGSSSIDFWDSYPWESAYASVQTDLDLQWVLEEPRYVIEEVTATTVTGADGGAIDFESSLVAKETVFYRITSRGVGGTENSAVVLQSTFKR